MTTTTKCRYCDKAEAMGVKVEVTEEYDTESNAIEVITEAPICDGCERYWFDGTEEHPGVRPL